MSEYFLYTYKMATVQQITVLTNIPQFTGNPRPGEPSFKPDIDARTFLRTLENHFRQHNITSDVKKIQILFSHIDKQRGDAINFITCYAGQPVTFDEVKDDLLGMYPSFSATEFKHAARVFLNTKLTDKNIFCAMTALENSSKAVAESYLNHELITEGKFNANSTVNAMTPTQVVADGDPQVPPPPPPRTVPLSLLRILQNYTMHLMVSTQVNPKIYDKTLTSFGPRHSSTKFMAETVKQVEKQKLLTSSKAQTAQEGFIFKTTQPQVPRRQHQQPSPRNTTPPEQPRFMINKNITCHNCGKTGHIKKECKSCNYCKKYGHSVKDCRTKLAKGKYCDKCKMKDSHNTVECRRQFKSNVRMVGEYGQDDWSDHHSNETTEDYNSEEAGQDQY